MGSVFSETTVQFFKRRSVRVLGAVAVVLGVAAGAAMALIPDSNGVINACYHNRTGALRVVDTAGDCNTQEIALSWKADALSNAVAGGDLTGSYPNPEIAADAVGSSEIAANAVGSSEIATGAVGSDEIAANAVGSSEIADNAVGSSEIADNAVGSSEIADGSVTSDDLAAGAIQLGEDSVTERELASNSLFVKQLVRSSLGPLVPTLTLRAGTVNSTNLQDSSVTSTKLVNGSITGTKLANHSVGTDALQLNAVTDDKLADEAVTESKIADGAVTGQQIDYARVQVSYENAAGDETDSVDQKGAIAVCPAGKVVSGGGFQLLGDPNATKLVTVVESQPFTPPGQAAFRWAVFAKEIGAGTDLNWGITAFAVCT